MPVEIPPPAPESYGRNRQSAIYRGGVVGELPKVPVGHGKLELAAQSRISPEAFAYIATGAGHEVTLRANRAAFEQWEIHPRVLRDVSQRNLQTKLFGKQLSSPFIISPIGVASMAHPEADLAIARAARALDLTFVLSNQASFSMEETVASAPGVSTWFQLYWSSSNELVESLVKRAEAAGAEAIVVTLDTHILGWRTRDLDLGYLPFTRAKGIAQYTSDPVFLELVSERAARGSQGPKPKITGQAIRSLFEISKNFPGKTMKNLGSPLGRAAVETFLDVFSKPSLSWKDLAFLRSITKLPILLKGVLHPDDAKQALGHGVDGIIVSNHGGRQVDGAIPTLTALPGVIDAVQGKIPVLLDSGVRSGADAFKAIALGATAVGIGRPYVYGLAVAGQAGVEEVITNLIAEFDITMGLAGHTAIDQIGIDSLRFRG